MVYKRSQYHLVIFFYLVLSLHIQAALNEHKDSLPEDFIIDLERSDIASTRTRQNTTDPGLVPVQLSGNDTFNSDSFTFRAGNVTEQQIAEIKAKLCFPKEGMYFFENITDESTANKFLHSGNRTVTAYTCGYKPAFVNEPVSGVQTFIIGSYIQMSCSNSTAFCTDGTKRLKGTTGMNLVEIHQINSTTTNFLMQVVSEAHEWMLCMCNTTTAANKLAAVGTPQRYVTGRAPLNITGFECTIMDFADVICSWDSQADRNVTWNICFSLRNQWAQEEEGDGGYGLGLMTCLELGPKNELSSQKQINDHLFAAFYFNISATNGFGRCDVEFNYTVEIVKLSAPPIQVAQPSIDNVQVLWSVPCPNNTGIRAACRMNGIFYELIVSIDKDLTDDLVNVDASDYNISEGGMKKFGVRNNSPSFLVLDSHSLLPYTNYKMKMRQRINRPDSLWSDYYEITHKTPVNRPSRGPFINSNAFVIDENACNGLRRATLYWQHLDVHNGGNGPIQDYIVTHGNETNVLRNAALREVSLCVADEQTDLDFSATNSAGDSISPTSFPLLSSEGTIYSDLEQCMVRALIHQVDGLPQAYVDWRAIPDVLGTNRQTNVTFTAFYCQYINNTCQREFEWIDLGADSRMTSLAIRTDADPSIYRYGVSVHNDSTSSGIIWSSCMFGAAGPSPQEDIQLMIEQLNTTHALVKILPKCKKGMAMLRQVNLNYCHTRTPSEQECEDIQTLPDITLQCNKYITLALDTTWYYNFWLTLSYHDVPGELTTEWILFKLNSSNEFKAAIIGTICGAVLLIASIIFLIAHFKRKTNRAKRLRVTTIQPAILSAHIKPDTLSVDDGYTDDDDDDNLLTRYWPSFRAAISPLIKSQSQQVNNQQTSGMPAGFVLNESVPDQERLRPLLSYQNSLDSANPRFHNDQLLCDDSDYGTNDNSGTSLGYRQVHSIAPPARDVQTREYYYDSQSSGRRSDRRDSGVDFSSVSACLRAAADLSTDQPLFDGITLQTLIKTPITTGEQLDIIDSKLSEKEEGLGDKRVSTSSSGDVVLMSNDYLLVDRISENDNTSITSHLSDAEPPSIEAPNTKVIRDVSLGSQVLGYTKFKDASPSANTVINSVDGTCLELNSCSLYAEDDSDISAIDLNKYLDTSKV